MLFAVKEQLTDDEIESGLRSVIKDGLTTQTMVTLTGGAFLVAFALKLGASNLVIGLLAAIPPLAQLMQIPAVYLVERYRVRRAICAAATAVSRSFWLLIALIPFLFNPQIGLLVLLLGLLLYASFGAIGSSSWNSWMHDLVPHDRLGAFFSKRMSLATAIGIPLSLAAGLFVDYAWNVFDQNELYSYSTLFFLGFLAGMLGVYFITTVPEPRMLRPVEAQPSFLKTLLSPLRDGNFKKLVWFLSSWNFAVNLAAPFFTVYMLNRLGLQISVVIALLIVSQLMNLAFLRLWGNFADRFSNKSVLGVSGPLFMLCILAWTFTTLPGKYALTMPLLVLIHIFMGISTAGVTLASGNIGLKLAPKGQATAYLAASTLGNSLAAGIAPIIGGSFADFFVGRELAWTLTYTTPTGKLVIPILDFQQWDFFFFFAFLLGLYSIHRLALVKESGYVKEKLVVRELITEVKRPLRNFSTAGGLRFMIQFPLSLARTTVEKAIERKNQRNGNSRTQP
ncbi:MAG: MFS transporter [Methanomicrobia archaeon]|nr:MFS transporter [Methanomicrobia archaeon]